MGIDPGSADSQVEALPYVLSRADIDSGVYANQMNNASVVVMEFIDARHYCRRLTAAAVRTKIVHRSSAYPLTYLTQPLN